jgi:hypothetical protein
VISVGAAAGRRGHYPVVVDPVQAAWHVLILAIGAAAGGPLRWRALDETKEQEPQPAQVGGRHALAQPEVDLLEGGGQRGQQGSSTPGQLQIDGTGIPPVGGLAQVAERRKLM